MTRAELIGELRRYFSGGRLYPIEFATESVSVLRAWRGPDSVAAKMLETWLANDDPEIPDPLLRECFTELTGPTRVNYPCRVPGCFSTAAHFAMGNEAKYGHVCKLCFATFNDAERGRYST